MKISLLNANNQAVLHAKLEGWEQLDPREMELLNAGEVDGLLPPRVVQGGGQLTLEYLIAPFAALEFYLSRITEQEQFVALVQNCISVFLEMERNGLRIDRIAERFDQMFVYMANQRIYFVYLPVPAYAGSFSVPAFFLGLIDRTPCNSQAFAQFGMQYRAFLQRPTPFTLGEFGAFVQAIHAAGQGQNVQPMPPQPVFAPSQPPEESPAPEQVDPDPPADEPAPAPPVDREPVWVTVSVPDACAGTVLLDPPEPVTHGELVRLKTKEHFPVSRTPFVIGRDAARSDLVIGDNPTVGRVHATVVRRGEVFFLSDNGSLNKSYLDGVQLEQGREYPLKDGAQVRLSDEELFFRLIQES